MSERLESKSAREKARRMRGRVVYVHERRAHETPEGARCTESVANTTVRVVRVSHI